MALVAAAGGLGQSHTPPPMVPTPPIPSQTPPVQGGTPGPPPNVSAQTLAANAAALAAAAAGQNGFAPVHAGGVNGGVLGSLEYQAAYQVGTHVHLTHVCDSTVDECRIAGHFIGI
jgi:hypothetical protein